MNDDDIRVRRHTRKRIRHRILPPRSTVDDRDGMGAVPQIGGRNGRELRRQRHDDVMDAGMIREYFDAALQDGPAPNQQQLLRNVAADAGAAPTGGDDR
jgi:hypothetical protein